MEQANIVVGLASPTIHPSFWRAPATPLSAIAPQSTVHYDWCAGRRDCSRPESVSLYQHPGVPRSRPRSTLLDQVRRQPSCDLFQWCSLPLLGASHTSIYLTLHGVTSPVHHRRPSHQLHAPLGISTTH